MFNWSLPIWADLAILGFSALVILIAGVKAAELADRLADRTGLGEALTGMVFLGLITALPGLVASVAAAYKGYPGLAISNALGGIAAQTAALSLADLTYPKANLEHAAASASNMVQAIMLILLLALLLLGLTAPEVALGPIHPITLLLILGAGGAVWLVYLTRQEPMWEPLDTAETIRDLPAPDSHQDHLGKLAGKLAVSALLTAASGALVSEAAANLVRKTAVPEVVIGGVLMALATSLPELVTSISAVRRGALTLAVSDIVGGNFFDVLFVAAADLAYLRGSIYHGPGVGRRELFLAGVTILLNVVLLAGLIYRQRRGPANIGFESALILVIYIAGFLVLSLAF